jgi:hypothetical protein
MATSPVLIRFDSDRDAEKGLDLLLDEREPYTGIREGIFVSQNAIRLFQRHSVRFTRVSRAKRTPVPTLLASLQPHGSRETIKKKHFTA